MKIYLLVYLALATVTIANADRLAQDDGDYGDVPTFLHQNVCLDVNGSVTGGNCAMTAQDWIDSVHNVKHVFDFLIDGNRSNFILTLTGTEAFSPDDPVNNVWSWGAFICNQFSDVQCGPDPTSQMASGSPTLSLDGKTATFVVSGMNIANTDNSPHNSFVFFAVEPDHAGSVSAAITSNTPEPGSFSVFIVAGLLAAALGRRRLAKLL